MLGFPGALMAQDSATAYDYWNKRNLPFAKQAVDEWCRIEPGSTGACYLLSARVYNEIALSLQPDLAPNAAIEASKHLMNAFNINRKQVTEELQAENFSLAKSIFNQVMAKASEAYNAGIDSRQQSHFQLSYARFIRAQLFYDFTKAANWGLPVLDTIIIANLARSGIKAGEDGPASFYATQLVQMNTDSVQGESVVSIWKWVMYYNYKIRKEASMVYIKERFENRFPGNSYASRIWINYKRESKDRTSILQAYQTALEKFASDRSLGQEAKKYATYILKDKGSSSAQQTLARQILKQY